MTPEKGTYRVKVESLPVLVSNVQSVLSHSNSWRANLPHFQAAALSAGQEIPPLLWPLSPRLIALSTACVLLCSWKCWVCWLDASFSMTRLTFRLLNWHKAQADWQCRGNNLRSALGYPHLPTELLNDRQQITSSLVPQFLLPCTGGLQLYHSLGHPAAEHCWDGKQQLRAGM